MTIDISIEYNCKLSDFCGQNVFKVSAEPMWVSAHTKKGRMVLSVLLPSAPTLHKRFLVPPSKIGQIRSCLRMVGGSAIYGGFYTKEE